MCDLISPVSAGQRWNHFVSDQVAWINARGDEVKRAGVLPPVARFPRLVDRIEASRESVSHIRSVSLHNHE